MVHMPFGKYKGMPIGEVPRGYVRWPLDKPSFDPFVRKAFQKYKS